VTNKKIICGLGLWFCRHTPDQQAIFALIFVQPTCMI
jgi:hypothetical protein